MLGLGRDLRVPVVRWVCRKWHESPFPDVFWVHCSILGLRSKVNNNLSIIYFATSLINCPDGSDLQCMTWLATTLATSSSGAGLSSLRPSVQVSSSSRWENFCLDCFSMFYFLFSSLHGRTWFTKATNTPGGLMQSAISWPALPWFASLCMPSTCGSPPLALGERLVFYEWKNVTKL